MGTDGCFLDRKLSMLGIRDISCGRILLDMIRRAMSLMRMMRILRLMLRLLRRIRFLGLRLRVGIALFLILLLVLFTDLLFSSSFVSPETSLRASHPSVHVSAVHIASIGADDSGG